MDNINKFAEMIRECNKIAFFGGAGVSTESGVKEYGVSPETILSRSFFTKNPEVFYDFYRKYFIIDAEPNSAHKALAKLEEDGKLPCVIYRTPICLLWAVHVWRFIRRRHLLDISEGNTL